MSTQRRGRRVAGGVDKLPSGRWRARYRTPDGRRLSGSFATKADADAWLAAQGTDRARGTWVDPAVGREPLASYATTWLAQRPDLRPRTRDDYADIIRVHLVPVLGARPIGAITPAEVRAWYAATSERVPGRARKAYRLLRTILNTAVADELIVRNPCRVRGAGQDRSAERPTATVPQVAALAGAVDERWQALVLLAAWCGLRRGELLGLRRSDVDLAGGTVRVERAVHYLRDNSVVVGPPKTAAGVRTVAVPPHLIPELTLHLGRWVASAPDAPLFTERDGTPLRIYTLDRAWRRARLSLGLPHLRLHDLRHTGNTLAAATGASTRELMVRMGHASPQAALIYQHASAERDQAIAAALSKLAEAE